MTLPTLPPFVFALARKVHKLPISYASTIDGQVIILFDDGEYQKFTDDDIFQAKKEEARDSYNELIRKASQ